MSVFSFSRSVHHVSAATVMTFGTEIHAPSRMNCTIFADPLTFHLHLNFLEHWLMIGVFARNIK